jgi:diguanylate cyclase (GGDEF)-like protein/PAS domain S-box-containing protein
MRAIGRVPLPLRTAYRAASLWRRLREALPRGQTLSTAEWESRHRAMLWILWAHVIFLPIFSLARGWSAAVSFGSVLPVALAGIAGTLKAPGRRARSVAVALGLLTASAVLVHAWNGRIEAHFHYFVMIAILALYEDWLPFGLAVIYVVVEHGVIGLVAPGSVYDHGGNPWSWALIHGLFVLAAAAAGVVTWRLNEDLRRRMEAAHRRARDTDERFRRAFASGVTGMALSDRGGAFLTVNEALCTILGYEEPDLLQRNFYSIVHPDDASAVRQQAASLLDGAEQGFEAEVRYLHREGRVVWGATGVGAVHGDANEVRYFVVQIHDVSARRLVEEQLAHQALHDPLTGLPNRVLFTDRLQQALVRQLRNGRQVAVLFIDLDRFKLINDGLGHVAGDSVLREAARRLDAAARAQDTVSRFGGDEFTVLCEDVSAASAVEIAERLLAELSQPFDYEGQELHLGASVGARVSDGPATEPDRMLRDADLALYAAKQRGRGRVELFDPAARLSGFDPLALEQALRAALRRGELRLHYQPLVDLTTDRVRGLEALLRWEHPKQGTISPGEFIPVAEQSGLIVPIGEWVLGEACRQLACWRADGTVDHTVQMAVNVSPIQLCRPELPGTVDRALASAGVEPEALCIEVTESAMIHEVALETLRELKDRGISIALDDFGVGFSSLSQIRELPQLDAIKVDRSFTAGLGENKSDGAVVRAVLSLAGTLGLVAVAEGVETEEQLERLRRLGCDIGQGFLLSQPRPAVELESYLRSAERVGGSGAV